MRIFVLGNANRPGVREEVEHLLHAVAFNDAARDALVPEDRRHLVAVLFSILATAALLAVQPVPLGRLAVRRDAAIDEGVRWHGSRGRTF